MLLLLWSVFLLGTGLRYAGESGTRRFEALSDERARGAHAIVGRDPRWPVGILTLLATAGAVLAASRGSTLDLCVSGATVMVSLVCIPVLRSARSTVEQGMTRRGLEAEQPVPGLPPSRTRARRVRQFGVAMAACYLGSLAALLVSEKTGAGWLGGVGLGLFVMALLAFFPLAWSAAWKFSDEENPATRSQP